MAARKRVKVSVLHRTSEFRGDHSTAVAVAYEPEKGETVEALAERILGRTEIERTFVKGKPVQTSTRTYSMSDWIEIRIMKPAGSD